VILRREEPVQPFCGVQVVVEGLLPGAVIIG